MAVRLRDVAERAGVSVRTVSNVVNDFSHVKPSTRARVQAAIDELGYRPNLAARQLTYGRSGFVTLAVPQIASPYFAELAQRFTEAAAERGYIALMDVTNGQREHELQVIAGLQSHRVDGIVFSPLSVTAADFAYRTDRTPLVLLGERAVPEGYDHVAVDSIAASRAMVEHLLHQGRHRIAAIGYETNDGTSSVRLLGYEQALNAAGIGIDRSLVVGVGAYTREEGVSAMQRLLSRPKPPDAVFCFNDLMAIGAITACRRASVQVPQDIAIAGFDGIAESAFTEPPLTTMKPDLDVLTRSVLDLLIAQIEHPTHRGVRDISVPWELVQRTSTAANNLTA